MKNKKVFYLIVVSSTVVIITNLMILHLIMGDKKVYWYVLMLNIIASFILYFASKELNKNSKLGVANK